MAGFGLMVGVFVGGVGLSSRPTERLITPVTHQTTFVVDVRELQAVID